MAIVWQTPLGVEGYLAAGRALQVPRFPCPTCREPLNYSGWYHREVRAGTSLGQKLWARRELCKFCGVSQAVLPSFVAHGRLDAVGVIGAGLEVMAAQDATTAGTARALELPRSTLRAWRRRFVERAELLLTGFARAAVALGEDLPRLPGEPAAAAIAALGAAWAGALRRFGGVGRQPLALRQRHGRRPPAQHQHRSAILLVDEAHLLTPEQLEEIRLLSNAELGSASPFAGVLLGQPTLAARLRQGVFAALDQRISVRYSLGGMDLAESVSYLRHHLEIAGREGPLIADDAAARLHRYANGLPRALNNAATASLMAAAADGKALVDDTCAKKAIAELTRT